MSIGLQQKLLGYTSMLIVDANFGMHASSTLPTNKVTFDSSKAEPLIPKTIDILQSVCVSKMEKRRTIPLGLFPLPYIFRSGVVLVLPSI